MKNNFLKLNFFFLLLITQNVLAISIDWTGGYRVEYVSVNGPTLADSQSKNYALNFLYLQPKIIGSDGINIISRFDIMPSQTAAYKNSQVGALIGGGLNDNNHGTGSNASSQNQNSTSLQVSQLYLNVTHEYGSLLVGRAPIEFGLGMTYNAGRGEFDHWIDTKEVLAYRFIVDNIAFTPMVARVKQDDFGGGIGNDQIYILEYNNKEIGARAGVFHQTRTLGSTKNDYLGSEVGSGTVVTDNSLGVKIQTVNIFLERKWTEFEFKLEASFVTGDTGVQNAAGEIKMNSYAVVAEALKPSLDSKWEWSAQLGAVSGDNPETENTYEGYQLDRNYNVGLLMFNHRLGQRDILKTAALHSNDSRNGNNLSLQNSVDDEAVSNVFFLAPSMKYKWDDKIDLKSKFIYGQLLNSKMKDGNNIIDTSKDLGLELNLELIYKPRERVTWSTGVGVLFPGSAWSAGNLNLDTKTTYGLETKASITF